MKIILFLVIHYPKANRNEIVTVLLHKNPEVNLGKNHLKFGCVIILSPFYWSIFFLNFNRVMLLHWYGCALLYLATFAK